MTTKDSGNEPSKNSGAQPSRKNEKSITRVRFIAATKTDFVKFGDTIQGRFQVLGKLRDGGFGQIYKATDKTTKSEVVIKVEKVVENEPNPESDVLAKFQGCKNCPRFYGSGTIGKKFSFIAMQLLGKNLNELRLGCKLKPQRFSAGTAHRLILQCLQAVESLHGLGFIHRDIKPANFSMGSLEEDCNTVFMLDFGTCQSYKNEDGSHRPYKEKLPFRGSTRYASLNAHEGKEQSRRDDLCSVFYSYCELMTGPLPWRKSNDSETVATIKRQTTIEQLSQEMPPGADQFAKQIRGLKYEESPRYNEIADWLTKCLNEFKIQMTDPFDWQVAECKVFMHWSVKKPN